ncbi:hypothetical protein [Croceicoccus sediminis]|uniref:hypothetical protein n=1 Tax=Croceicoccus sediminis TaxID=2571150 RepID=UPI001479067C|nr:hypothetical protein [Croceicoccus sediminis]
MTTIGGNTRKAKAMRIGRFMLGGSVAAAALAAISPAHAQVNANGVGQFGTDSIVNNGSTTTVTITPTETEALIDWTATDADVFLDETSTLAFQSGGPQYTVLNRITPVAGTTNPLAIDGFVSATWGNGQSNVWFYNPNGFVVGGFATFDVNGLVLSASPIQLAGDGTLPDPGTPITFGQAINPDASITFLPRGDSDLQLSAQQSYLAVVAPRIQQSANINVNGSVGYVAAEAATMTISFGIFDVQVDVGTTDANGIVHDGSTFGPAGTATDPNHRQYFVTVPKNDAVTMLLSGNVGYNPAASAGEVDGLVVLSAGYGLTGGGIDLDTPSGDASILVDGLNSSSEINAFATNNITISDAGGIANVFQDNALFGAFNSLDVTLSQSLATLGEAALQVQGDLFLFAGFNEATSGALSIDVTNGAFMSVFGDLLASGRSTLDATVDTGGAMLADGDIRLISARSGIGNIVSGDVTLTVVDGTVAATNLYLESLAFSDGTATAGSATLATTGPNASMQTINVAHVWALGMGGDGNPDGAFGTGGTAQVLMQDGQMLFGLDSIEAVTLDIRADGGAGARTDAAGTLGGSQGGTALLSVSGGDLQADGISVYARGLSHTLDNAFNIVGGRSAGDGFDAAGGSATVSVTGGTVGSFNFPEGVSLDISATGYGSSARGSAIAGGDGGSGQGGTAQFLQAGGFAQVATLDVNASGMGGAGSNQNVEGFEPVGDGGDGTGGTALVRIDGGTLNMFGGIAIRAEGNPRSPDPVLGTQAGQGGSAQGGTAGTGGTGTGGSASLIVAGGDILGQIANGLPSPFGVTVSAAGFGGDGGTNDPFFFAAFGGTGGDGLGGDALYEFAGGSNEASIIDIGAAGLGGAAGSDGSGGDSGQFAGSNGGSGFGGSTTLNVLADLDTTAGGPMGQFITLISDGVGADGGDSDTGNAGTGGNGTAGSASVIADGAALTFDSLFLYAYGNGGSGGDAVGTGADGGAAGFGIGGDIRMAAINGGALNTLTPLYLDASGFGGFGGSAADGTGGAGALGSGGTVIFETLDGAITHDFLGIYAEGYAGEGGFGTVAGIDGDAAGGAIFINAAGTGSILGGGLSAYADGILVESVVAGGTIALTDTSSGTVQFDSLFFDNGYDAGLQEGGITVTSTLNPITVLGTAQFFTSGDLVFQAGNGGGFVADTLDAFATGAIRFLCLTATCTEQIAGANGMTLVASGEILADGLSFGSGGATSVIVDGGDLTLTGSATAFGGPLDLSISGSLLGTGTVFSSGDLGLTVGGDIDIGTMLVGGQLVQSGAIGAPVPTLYTTPGTFNVGSLSLGTTSVIEAGTSIALGDVQTAGNALSLFAPGAVTIGTASNISALTVDGASIGFGTLVIDGPVGMTLAGDVTGGTIDALGDVTILAGGALLADGIAAGGAVLLDANSITLGAVSALGDIDATSAQDLVFTALGAGGAVLLTSIGGNVTGGSVTAGGDVVIDAAGNLSATAIDSGASVILTANTISGLGPVTAVGDIDVLAAAELTFTALDAGGVVSLTSTGGDVTGGSVTAGGDVVIDAAGNLSATAIDSGASVILTANTISELGPVTSVGDIDASTAAGLTFTALDAGGVVSLTSTGGDVTGGSVTAGGDVVIDAAGNLSATAIDSGASVILTANTISGLGPVTAVGDIDALTAAGLTFTALDAGGVVSLTSTGGDVTGGSVTAGGDVVIDAAGVLSADAVSSGGTVFVTAASVAGLGPVGAAGDVSVFTTGAQAVGPVTSGGIVTLVADGGDVLLSGLIDAAGDITVITGGDISGGSLVSGGSLYLSANAVLGIDALSAPLDISVFTNAGQSYSAITAGQGVSLFSATGAISVADLVAGGLVSLYGADIDVASSGALNVTDATGFDGNVAITTTGALAVSFAEASGDIVLTSTGASVTVGDLFAGVAPTSPSGQSGQSGQAVVIPALGAGNIALTAATDVNVLGTALAAELFGIDAGNLASIDGTASGRLVYIEAADLAVGALALIGSATGTDDISIVATGNAALGAGVASPGFLLDAAELARFASAGGFSLSAGGTLAVGDVSLVAGSSAVGSGGTMALMAAGNVTVSGGLLLGNADGAMLMIDSGGDLYVNSAGGSIRVRSGGVQAGSLMLSANTIVAGSAQTLSDIATLDFPELTDALGAVDGGDGRSLIEGGSVLVDAGGFYVANTGADTSFDARRGIVADSMTVTNSGGTMPFVVINGVVAGEVGLDTAFAIAFPLSAVPYSSVNGCYIGFGGLCGPTIDIELVKKIINEEPPHSVLDGEPRSTIETRIITIEKSTPEGFEPLIDEPVTGTGNDDLWEDSALDGKQCPVDVRQDECEEEDGDQ